MAKQQGVGGKRQPAADETVANSPLKPKTVAPGKPKTVAPVATNKSKTVPPKPKTRSAGGRAKPGTRPGTHDSTVKRRPPKNISPGRLNRAGGNAEDEGEEEGEELEGRHRKVRFGLAFKFCLPVGAAVGLALVIYIILAVQNAREMLINGILKSGASGVSMLAEAVRPMLKAELETGHEKDLLWPVSLKLMEENQFLALAEVKVPENEDPKKYISRTLNDEKLAKVRKDGQLLRNFVRYPNPNGDPFKNEILDAYATTTTGVFVAGSQPFKGSIAINYEKDWLGGKLTSVSLSGETIDLSRSGISVQAGVVEADGQERKVLAFEIDVLSGRAKLGKAILAIDAQPVEDEVKRLNLMLYGVGAVALFLVVGLCIIIASIVTQPVYSLIKDMNIVADGDLAHTTRAHSADEIGIIAEEFNQMTRHLLVAREREKEAERLENELNIAREIQMKLLPPKVPRVKGFDMHAVYKPAKEVGGDYYDFLPISSEHLGVIVADVSGKGIPGSMVMSTTRTILHFVALDNLSSADTLTKVNAIVAANIKRGMFVTAFYLVIDVRHRQMVCSSAGHNPMVILHADGTLDKINPSGIALGFDKGKVFQRTIKEEQIVLQQGDRVVLYTDGVVEAMNEYNQEYTDERFYEFVQRNNHLDSKDFVAALLADLEKHKGDAEQHDDITIVTFRVV